MRFWREIVGDRLSGGVIHVLLMVAFALQFGLAAQARAAMASPDPLAVLCTSQSDATTHRPSGPDHRQECPCANLCCAGIHMPATPPPVDSAGIPIRFAERVEIAVDHSSPLAAEPVLGRPLARAPPAAPIRN